MRDMKLTITLYLLIGIPIGAIIACFIITGNPSYLSQLFLALLAFFFFIIVLILFLQALANKRLAKMRYFLFEKCDPEQYIQIYIKKMRKNAILTKLDLSVGYIHLGDYETALSLIQSISLKSAFNKKTYEFYYYNHLFAYFLRKGDAACAQKNLDMMKSFLSKGITPSLYLRHSYVLDCLVKQYDINIMQGNYDGALEFLNALPPAENMLETVSHHYKLAQVHAGLGNPAAAREALNFVIENGNKTVYVSLAQKLLSEIE